MDVDPYKFLGVPKNFTPDQLRGAFKKMALTMHPDKQSGNDYMFKLLTTCYKTLVKEYNAKISDKQFNELKKESQKHVQNYAPLEDPKKSFSIDKFNTIFDKNKLPDNVKDTGYDDWLKNAEDEKQAKMKGKFTNESFNNQFNKHTGKQEQNKHLIKYKEPEAMFTGKKIQYTELGVENVDDFSADNLSRKNLNYMDLKLAHTTSRIVDPNTVADRKIYKTVGDVESDRANINYNMSEMDMRDYQLRKQAEDLKEKKRLTNLSMYDKQSLDHYEKVNRLMLGSGR